MKTQGEGAVCTQEESCHQTLTLLQPGCAASGTVRGEVFSLPAEGVLFMKVERRHTAVPRATTGGAQTKAQTGAVTLQLPRQALPPGLVSHNVNWAYMASPVALVQNYAEAM